MRNGNGSHKNGKGTHRCATPGCANTAQPSGYCFPCELAASRHTCKTPGCTCRATVTGYCYACEEEYGEWARDLSNWFALRDALMDGQNGARR